MCDDGSEPQSQEMCDALRAYWAATTQEEETIAYARCRALGLPASYDEAPDDTWHEPWSHGGWTE